MGCLLANGSQLDLLLPVSLRGRISVPGQAAPNRPSSTPSVMSATPVGQLTLRDLRSAPVKNTYRMWAVTATMNGFAAEWCVVAHLCSRYAPGNSFTYYMM